MYRVEYLEGVFLRSPFVGQVWVYGSSYKRFLVSVVVPDADYVQKWAKDNGIQGDYATLCKSEQLKKAIYADLEKIGKEAKVSWQVYVYVDFC
jgi:long-chain acyl-CoA synthetase